MRAREELVNYFFFLYLHKLQNYVYTINSISLYLFFDLSIVLGFNSCYISFQEVVKIVLSVSKQRLLLWITQCRLYNKIRIKKRLLFIRHFDI